jgi:hypothetical protein
MTNRSSGARVAVSGVMLLLLGVTSVLSAGDVAAVVAPLLAARVRGSLGSVEGRAYAEGRPGGEATPYASVSVLLLPRSAAFEAELEAIKTHSRDSPDAYIEAEPKVSAARLAFERTLIDTGAGQLILGESSDGAGAFRFQRVPEGAWLLLAWRETPHAKRPPAPKRSEAERFKTRPQVFGQTTVVLWWRPVIVKAGEEAVVQLHDRNEWLTAVREDRRVPDQDQPATPRTQQGTAPR